MRETRGYNLISRNVRMKLPEGQNVVGLSFSFWG